MYEIKPYLIIPKLIEQPTWGGSYIVEYKGWKKHKLLHNKRIGQAYELYKFNNLTSVTSAHDKEFPFELTDSTGAYRPTKLPNTITLADLVDQGPAKILGEKYINRHGASLNLLIKFTQARGNSFQIHVPPGTTHSHWRPKPESWYYFEPGLITLGVKRGVDWKEYETVSKELNREITNLSLEVKEGILSYRKAQVQIQSLLKKHDPWQFVNQVEVKSDQLIDLSPCGLHHSWEEDEQKYALGNVVYELQVDVADNIATIRNFDKGKMASDGQIRPLQIDDYFKYINRDPIFNQPLTHFTRSKKLKDKSDIELNLLLKTANYTLKQIRFKLPKASFREKVSTFRHVFVREGEITLNASLATLTLTRGHSAFIPAGVYEYEIRAATSPTEVLVSY